jgi:orotate phosphoribosyltransferase
MRFEFRRQTIQPGAKVMVVDDVGTSGRSIELVCAAVEAAGATVVAKGVLVARTGCPEDILRVVDVKANTYEPDNLPEHLANIPVIKPGTSQT